MLKYVVKEGEIYSSEPNIELPEISFCGFEWVIVEAISEKDAIHQACLYDDKLHPKQKLMNYVFDRIKNSSAKKDAINFIYEKLFYRQVSPDSIVIEIEALGYTSFNCERLCGSKRYWVAEIVDLDKKWKFKRLFLNGKVDLSRSNAKASKGVYIYYTLETGKIYEVSIPVSNKNTNRYFCKVENDNEVIISEGDVINCLKGD